MKSATRILALLMVILVGVIFTLPTASADDSISSKPGNGGNLFLSAGDGNREQISLDLPAVELTRGANGEAVFLSPGARQLGLSGEPGLPWSVFTVLLPPAAELSTVACRLDAPGYTEITGMWAVEPVPPLAGCDASGSERVIWPAGKRIVDGRDADIYQNGTFWPADPVRLKGTGRLHHWKLAEIAVPLFRYNPAAATLEQLESGRLVVDWDNENLLISPSSISLRGSERVRKLAVNFEQAVHAYDTAATPHDSRQTGYAIITTSSVVTASSALDDFIAHKTALGYDVTVVTEADFGGGQGDTAAENVRAWLQANYVADDIHYVLIIGNPDPAVGYVPMKMCYDGVSNMNEMPTDFFYSDLSGDWDLNGDSYSGQWEDMGTGGIDRYWEVLVGRIPYYGVIGDMDAILQKIITYETSSDTGWRRNALLPMVPLDDSTPAYQLGEQIKTDLLEPIAMPSHRIYTQEYGVVPPPETTPCSYHTVSEAWDNLPFGVVVWMTHGWDGGASEVVTVDTIGTLNDTFPSATFQASCSNATPEATNNIAYALLKHGGIATNGATRVGWYYVGQTDFSNTDSVGGLAYQYAARLAGGFTCGEAWCDTRQDMTPGIWMNYCTHNIYGDPSVVIVPPAPEFTVTPTDLFYVQRVRGESPGSVSRTYTLSNNTGSSLQWTAVKSSAWVSLSSSGGSIAAGGTFDLEASLTAAADDLPVGTHTDTILITDVTHGTVLQREIKLVIVQRKMEMYLELDETNGFVAHDASGYGNDGWLEGDLRFENDSVSGRYGPALAFDGTGGYVDLAHLALDDLPPPWSLSVWVKRLANGNAAAALMSSSAFHVKLEQWPSTQQLGLTILGVADYTFDYSAPLDNWAHLVLMGTGSGTELWVNGALEDTLSVSVSLPMGSIGGASVDFLAAVIDDFRIYNYQLTMEHIAALTEGGPAENPAPPDGETGVATNTELSWVSGAMAAYHDVYFGTDRDAVSTADTASAEYIGRQTEVGHTPALADNMEYYWRIDQIRLGGATTGPVWSFSTASVETVDADITCMPASGTVPFTTAMTVTLTNPYTAQTRRIAGRINVDLAGGQQFSNWKSGWSNIIGGAGVVQAWNQNMPALGSVIGNNVFHLIAEDVTPPPYNQPPNPPAGGTDTSICTVIGIAP